MDTVQLPDNVKFTHKRGERTARVKSIGFPEDRLVESFYARNPDVRPLCMWSSAA